MGKGRKEEGGKIEHVQYEKEECHLEHKLNTSVETEVREILDLLKV